MFSAEWIIFIFPIIIAFLIIFLSRKLSERCDSAVCLLGKVALVTGGSSGIGYQMVLDLAKRGCKVIIADKNDNESIVKTIIDNTNNKNIKMEFVDFTSFASVRRLVERIKQTEEKLDILINNAGVLNSSDNLTEDGLTPIWQINYYSGFLLTHLLTEILQESQSSRIIFTTSGLSFFNNLNRINLSANSLMDESNSAFHYSNTKCLNIIESDLFAEKLKHKKITCNAFHPGIVNTQIFQRSAIYSRNWTHQVTLYGLYVILFFFGKSANEGAQTGVHLAVSKEVEGISGKFFGQCSPTWKPRFTNKKLLCERIWKLSEEVVGLTSDEKL